MVKEKEAFVQSQSERLKEMDDGYNTLKDFLEVLLRAQTLQLSGSNNSSGDNENGLGINHDSVSVNHQPDDQRNPLLNQENRELKFSHIAGTIETEDKPRMKKLLFRATKGTTLVMFSDFDQVVLDTLGKEVQKSAYFITFQDVPHIRNRVVRICESFNGQRFDLPQAEFLHSKINEVKLQLADADKLRKQSRRQLRTYLEQINKVNTSDASTATLSQLEIMRWYVAREKALFHAMNMFKQNQAVYIGYFWTPAFEKERVFQALRDFATTRCVEMFNHNIMPPTHFQGNDFTGSFQEIVNTYGIPTYKEVNPAVFACVSFPFLFGVMFGDVGHGSLLLLFALLLVFGKDKLKGTPLEMMEFGRYLFLLMGFFAVFNGLCYNEFFAMPMQATWGTCFEVDKKTEEEHPHITKAELIHIDYYMTPKDDCVYPIGVDYSWGIANNRLAFTNVMKMKISVILAIAQMSIGIIVKAINATYHKDWIQFFFEFIPMLTLLLVLFGWMDVLIIGKWLVDWPNVKIEHIVDGKPVV